MTAPEILDALRPVVAFFEALGVPYQVGGSVASSAYGVPRSSLDVDVVADLQLEHVPLLVARLGEDYYVDGARVEDAIRRRGHFNAIHLQSMIKVDVFTPKDRPFDRECLKRRRLEAIEEGLGGMQAYLTTPEDIILHKLLWFRSGGELSERQWLDVLGVIKVQEESLDRVYLRKWAETLGVGDLLERAYAEAGTPLG